MNTLKRLLSMLLAVALLASLTACGGDGTAESTEPSSGAVSNETGIYTVTVMTQGGMMLEAVAVYIYADNTLSDLKQYGETDVNGQVNFELPVGDAYAVVISGVPEGYQVEESYAFSGNSARIVLSSALISGENLSAAALGVGDVMYDFTVTTADGENFTLSEALSQKKAVLINFWYTTCTYCVAEFPYMEEAYQAYGDDVEIIALNPFDDVGAIQNFQAEMGLSFPMAQCQMAWSSAFGISGYPTSILVDRYGVICLIEAGGITSLRPFTCMFDHFTADTYEQKLFTALSELVTNIKPNVTMEASEVIAQVINGGEIDVTYRPETDEDDAEYSWPFVITEKNGEACLKASNQEVEDSYAILYADVYLEAGQAFGFDYLSSCESAGDILYVIVNDDDIYQISGVNEQEAWSSCYPCVAQEDGYYELALCYLKDGSINEGDDTVYIKNLRIVSPEEIDVPTYLPREAATTVDGFEYSYVDIVLNESDGYYHVGSADGPLLLANLMGYTQFNEEKTVFDLTYEGGIKLEDGTNMYDEIVEYCSYASNASLGGICTVNEELAELLKVVAQQAGFDGTEQEWMKICTYYEAYGADGAQLTDPIAGLATFSAFEAKLGKDVQTNYFYYDRPIIPRGLLAEFVPTRSGVYRITSKADSQNGVEAWICDENGEMIYTYEHDERMNEDTDNVSIVYYMEAGKAYYIDIAFWDMYEYGYIYYDIEYLGATYNLFRLASPGYFTYDTNATGEAMYYTISGGIDVVLKDDGYYYHDLGLDENGNQRYGSKLYADFTGLTSIFDTPIATVYAYDDNGNVILNEDGTKMEIKGMIEKGAFDFSKTEDDLYILAYLEEYNFDVDATDEYLRSLWGEEYDAYAQLYQLEDVYAGRYHGDGEDLTEEVRAYLDKMETSPADRKGCVAVDARLAEILQMVMDKYTFRGVDDSWCKLCYYYDYMGK